MNRLMILASLALLGVLHAPARAQLPERPQIFGSSGMGPDALEISPALGTIVSLRFGTQVVHHNNTALVWEPGFQNASGETVGRVAVFSRNAQGGWVRSASIDARKDIGGIGEQMALFNDHALIGSNGRMFLYQNVQGRWKLIQQLAPQAGYAFTEASIWNNWAFIGAISPTAGAVHVYQFTSAGTLRGVQTLRSFSGNPADHFGQHISISNGRVLVSADGDDQDRGAAYVFELSGSLFVKRQKLIPINGARGDGFAASVGISSDWIAIGAPSVDGVVDFNCLGSRTTGAFYVFRRINGTWLQQDKIVSGEARDAAFSCISQLGSQLMISGPWLVIKATVGNESGDSVVDFIYKRDTTAYTARADTRDFFGDADIYLANNRLLIGEPFDVGCIVGGACLGRAGVYDLDKAGL